MESKEAGECCKVQAHDNLLHLTFSKISNDSIAREVIVIKPRGKIAGK